MSERFSKDHNVTLAHRDMPDKILMRGKLFMFAGQRQIALVASWNHAESSSARRRIGKRKRGHREPGIDSVVPEVVILPFDMRCITAVQGIG